MNERDVQVGLAKEKVHEVYYPQQNRNETAEKGHHGLDALSHRHRF
jgi:hypothetical protein